MPIYGDPYQIKLLGTPNESQVVSHPCFTSGHNDEWGILVLCQCHLNVLFKIFYVDRNSRAFYLPI